MNYRQIQPPDYLKDHIRYFWTLENSGVDVLPKSFGIIADGCPGLIFQQTGKGTFHHQYKQQLPPVFLYGQTTRHTAIHLTGQFSTIGICFYPNALKSIFSFSAGELTDSCVDLDLLSAEQGTQLSEQLLNATDMADQIKVLSSYLFFQINKNNAHTDKITQHILSQIITSKGNISLKNIQEEVQLSERSFERKFKECVGVSPKLFSRICRFQASLHQLQYKNYDKLSDIAFENDYADQSHFIRDFKMFAGFSPYQYQKQPDTVIKYFPALIK